MPTSERKTLAVIGAGPKGIAVAVKAKVLEEFGLPVDRVILIEKNGVAAHWTGDFGYTNGEMKLGTSPEKDVVFPLETDVGDDDLNERIRQRLLQFTWMSFMVQTRRYSDWVDRGRPAPCHQLWALYLHWVADQLTPQATLVTGEVLRVDLSADQKQWELSLRAGPSDATFVTADRLMLTGPGQTRMDFVGQRKLPMGVYDLESFWGTLKTRKFATGGRLAIIGAGENAASALLALAQYAPHLRIDVISPKGFISTRAESYYENQVYSHPERNGWTELELADRLDFIERTDLGVFSTHAMNILNEQIRHQIVPGRAVGLDHDGQNLVLKLEYRKQILTREYEQVILATGFDQMATLKSVLSDTALAVLERAVGESLTTPAITARIQPDLSVRGMQPTLHLPMLAGLMQGPGFANLSCLGRLSDRIVTATLGAL